jgi:xanthine dehydrogenase iron-sulfur cluster and FAD-binding subunit A
MTESTRLQAEAKVGGSVVDLSITINGTDRLVSVEARRTLSDVIRDDLGLTGTHLGCEHGVCGACTVLLDGEPARSCLMFAGQAEGAEITTIEGLAAPDGTLHPIQQAMMEAHGFQLPCSPTIQTRPPRRSARNCPATCVAALGISQSWPVSKLRCA